MPFPEEFKAKFYKRRKTRGQRRDNPLMQIPLGRGAVS